MGCFPAPAQVQAHYLLVPRQPNLRGLMTARTHDAIERPVTISLGIFAWNEERVIAQTLYRLFQQGIFECLRQRNVACEILCLVNGCTDQTPAIARRIFAEQASSHPHGNAFQARVIVLPAPGKLNAWNEFVHTLSAKEARFLVFMDSDIVLDGRECLLQLIATLETSPRAHVSVDRPIKDIAAIPRRSLRHRISLGASRATRSAPAQLCAQLYAMPAHIARRIYLPKDLPACEDGFIKALVTTDFLTSSTQDDRICLAPGAQHTFEAYTSLAALVRNHKRQVMGQTVVHILIDRFLPTLPSAERANLADTLRQKDRHDPDWLKRLLQSHLAERRWFFRLYPHQLGLRLSRLRRLSASDRLRCLPAALASLALELSGSFLGFRALRHGSTHYWPAVQRAPAANPDPRDFTPASQPSP